MVAVHSSLDGVNISKETVIGVLCGGMSSEREVSLRSGKNCFEALKRLGYKNAVLIDVDKDIANTLKQKGVEVAYIALHGKYGEDGGIQGLLEILGIPYTGCGVKASAICMDKETTKRVVATQGVPVIPSVIVNELTDISRLDNKAISFPVMVKPINEGSSIGMSKVDTPDKLEDAVKEAMKYNSTVMLENFVEGKSVTVGVLDKDGETIATPILELRSKTGWYDYEAKYTKGLTEFILPAEIDEKMTEHVQNLAVKAHKAADAWGMSRIDFIVTENEAYMLEINTIPGMTDLSDLPAQAKEMGIEYDQLVEIILKSAKRR
ncbi:MAG: D-alanine--D-alanine ligase [Candidatus Gastranaerophilales bacterium]|nr:D-alanine--D-alanine ligase [Candidatus Gastranaerophilales bacterium]